MARGRREIPPCSKTYGFPIYCAAWVPIDRISVAAVAAEAEEKEDKDEAAEEEAEEKEDEGKQEGGEGSEGEISPSSQKDRLLVALGGGGGEGRSGVPNALVISEFDLASRSLSDQPVFRMGTDAEVPYRMAVHPGGDGILCSFPKGCRWFEWDFPERKESHKLALKSSEKKLSQLVEDGLQLAVAFNAEGSMLATGGEDGHLRVFKWPSLEIILDQTDAHVTVKDLHFSLDGKFLVSLGNSGPCRVWDLISSTAVAHLPREDGEVFGFCRFSQSTDNSQILLITAMHGDQGKIVSWNTLSWKRLGSKKVVRDPISAFHVATDGKLFAIGTVEGNIMILNSDMQVQTIVKKAHLGIVTALTFSQDSRALMSASFDSSARVTLIESRKSSGLSMLLVVLVIILAILVYFMKLKGVL
ncbi:SEC12-like protein 2 [Phoenix dactylifera]|uniref:SEC12-like protein 2 n=1 Tax=Phoenix dactylifera TaxID=42345 RepID=A0A8B7BNJ0_PHODC|nr:SEC12-like protein 2 [Phoenix dactylifera]